MIVKLSIGFNVQPMRIRQRISSYDTGVYDQGQIVEFPIDISKPKLWWPNGYGKQNLYELRVTVHDRITGEKLDDMSRTIWDSGFEDSGQSGI